MSLNDVQLLLADVALIIILARLLGNLARRLGQPPVLGEILAGILLGPTFFHGTASSGPPPEGALLVVGKDGAAAVVGEVHLTVRAGSSEDIEARPEIATPVSALEPGRQP